MTKLHFKRSGNSYYLWYKRETDTVHLHSTTDGQEPDFEIGEQIDYEELEGVITGLQLLQQSIKSHLSVEQFKRNVP